MAQRYSSLELGTSRLFAEATPTAAAAIGTDDYGFIKPSSTFFTFERLLQWPCSLIVAPPWTGKTFVAKRIEAFLRDGRTIHRTDFEAWRPSEPVVPEGWDRWLATTEQVVWIIDALDEAQRKERATWPGLSAHLADMPASAQERLRLLIFARDGDIREVAPTLEDDLADIFGSHFLKARLLPLDAENAADLLAEQNFDGNDMERVLSLIKCNGLQAVAGLPAALLYLANSPGLVELSERDVWKGVLQQILEEHGPYRQRFQAQPEERFAAAARMATILTLSGNDSLQTSAAGEEPSIGHIFPFPPPPGLLPTRAAATEALRSGMFRDSCRFLHKNVREWMAAFGMSHLPLAKLRPILQKPPSSPEAPASIRAEFHDLAQLLDKVHVSPAVQAWLRESLALIPPGDLFSRSLSELRPLLDRMEQLAARGGKPGWLEDRDSLRHLAVDGIGQELATRISDITKPSWARVLLLRVGAGLDLEEVLQTAARLVANRAEDLTVRAWSASVVKRSDRQDLLRPLQDIVEGPTPESREEREIISTLIAAMVEAGLWSTARAFRATPPGPAGAVIGATRVLPHVLERYMTLDDAVDVVTDLSVNEVIELNQAAEADHERAERQHHPRWEILASAAQKLASCEPPDPNCLRPLIPFVLSLGDRTAHDEWTLINSLRSGFRSSELARRELFEATVAAVREDRNRDVSSWLYQLLTADDLSWLEERLISLANDVPELWPIALRLSRDADNSGISRRVRALARGHAPAALSRFDEWMAQDRTRRRRERRRKEREEAKKRRIDEVDRELMSIKIAPKQRLHQLSWVNFSDQQFRPRNLNGEWSDVPGELQREVLDFCITALDSVDPSSIPEGSSFPAGLMYEAQAFLSILRLCPNHFHLTSERIRRWLPAVLRTVTDDKRAVLEQCLKAAHDATEEVVLDAIARELRGDSSYSVVLQDLPNSLWSIRVTSWVVEQIECGQAVEAAPRLLELLASRRPDEGRRLAGDILADLPLKAIICADSGSDLALVESIELRALDVLSALDPELALPHIKEGVDLAGRRFLEHLRGFTENARYGLRVKWETWPAQRLGELAVVLFTAYPPDEDPPEKSGLVTPAHELRRLRWNVLEHMVRMDSPEVISAIEAVGQAHPKAREIVDRLQADREANELRPEAPRSQGIGVNDACRLLDVQEFRIIRNDHDLLEVVLEVLNRMSLNLGDDLALFYYRTKKGVRRQHEAALQAYVRRRLTDLLPGKVLDRETKVKRDKRFDIRVLASAIGQTEQAKVVIEIKWSDNRSVAMSLKGQLGDDYLVGEGLRYGVFLVGWNGRLGSWASGSSRPDQTAESLQKALEQQAQEFHQQVPESEIRALVWNLEWRTQPSPRRQDGSSKSPPN